MASFIPEYAGSCGSGDSLEFDVCKTFPRCSESKCLHLSILSHIMFLLNYYLYEIPELQARLQTYQALF